MHRVRGSVEVWCVQVAVRQSARLRGVDGSINYEPHPKSQPRLSKTKEAPGDRGAPVLLTCATNRVLQLNRLSDSLKQLEWPRGSRWIIKERKVKLLMWIEMCEMLKVDSMAPPGDASRKRLDGPFPVWSASTLRVRCTAITLIYKDVCLILVF